MKEFIANLVSLILTEGTAFEVREEPAEELTVYTILAPEEEIGKVIGKEGKVISAIRTLSRLKAAKEQKRILVKVDRKMA